MPRRLVANSIDDEVGNRLGGSATELRFFTDKALTTLATLYANDVSGTTIPNPTTPNAGDQVALAVATAAIDTTITVDRVGLFVVGNRVPIYDGTNTVYRTITAINTGTRVFTLDSAVGFIFAIGTPVGNADMQGDFCIWIDDAQDYFAATKDVGSTRLMPPVQIPVRNPVAPIQAQEEGSNLANPRNTLNVIGASATIVDNAGSNRYDLTITGLQADGAIGSPSIGFVNDTDTGRYRTGANDMADVVGGHIALEYTDVAAAVNYLILRPAATGGNPSFTGAGTDTDVGINLVPKGAGQAQYNGNEIATVPVAAGLALVLG